MSKSIYDHHRAAFSKVSAAVLMYGGEQLGNIAFKCPADGAGRLYCYLHIHGKEMVRGSASGYGYDKKGAAFESAVSQYIADNLEKSGLPLAGFGDLSDIGGSSWHDALRAAGVTVLYAV